MLVERVADYSTVFQVWKEIFEKRQDVMRQTAKVYADHPHGQPEDQQVVVLPRERIVWNLDELNFFGQQGEIKAIGAHVEVRPKDFDPEIDYSGAGRWYNDGEPLEINPRSERAYIFVDCESPPTNEMLGLSIKTLRGWNMDWYLLNSGGSFHIIIDKLVSLEALPKYYGQLIMDMARNMSLEKSKLYGHIGKYLFDNFDNKHKLRLWTESIREKIGHIEDPISSGKLVFPLDLKYFIHIIDALIEGRDDEGFLRVSSKHGSVPVLKAQQINGDITIYESEKDPFDQKQFALPGF